MFLSHNLKVCTLQLVFSITENSTDTNR
uniref:Uncharacterized protein n=1 Tax=Anguilla anguilla TaxID=7936 RepID=A0A0E9QH65_ANGAN